MPEKKAIVVGAGPGGLAAAMLLAHRGFAVEVFERSHTVGGRSTALQVGSYVFDTGPTFLMMKFILDEVFSSTGRRTEDYLNIQRLDPMYALNFPHRTVYATDDHARMKEELEKKFPQSRIDLDAFHRLEKHRFQRLLPALKRDYSHWTSLLSPELLRALPHFGINSSLFDVLGRYFDEEEAKLSFTFQAKYLGMSPFECPGGFAIIPYIEHTFGIHHVEGGLNRICHAMARVVEEEGGQVHTSSPVAGLLTSGRRVTGVRLEDGNELAADCVIMNADFGHAMTNLVPPELLRKYAPQRLEKRKLSCSTFMLYLGLDTKLPLEHHNIYFSANYRQNLKDIFDKLVIPEDFSFYVQNPSLNDPNLAPPGHSALYVLVPVPNTRSGLNWEELTASFTQQVLERLGERCGHIDVASHVVEQIATTPDQWEQDYCVYRGATFNLAHNIPQMLYWRPHNRFEELQDLYLVGGGTHPGSGLPTIYQSALISSELAARSAGL